MSSDEWSPIGVLQDGETALMLATRHMVVEGVKAQLRNDDFPVNETNEVCMPKWQGIISSP